MAFTVVALTAAFFVASLIQLYSLQTSISSVPAVDLTGALAGLDDPTSDTERLVFAEWKTLARMEEQVVARRYHQANVLLMARTWTTYLGFLTGMILSMVGAVFILGKLREESISLNLEHPGVKADLNTTSPGVILCVLGTTLILCTLLTHRAVEITETNPLYLRTVFAPATTTPSTKPDPPPVVRDPLAPADTTNPVAVTRPDTLTARTGSVSTGQ